MKYLLDTDVVIKHLRGNTAIDISWLESGAAISIITRAELLNGAYKSKKTENNIILIENLLEDLQIKTINLNADIIHTYSELRAKLEKKGQKLDEFDLLIAATALSQKLKLLTYNHKHFERIPNLKLAKL